MDRSLRLLLRPVSTWVRLGAILAGLSSLIPVSFRQAVAAGFEVGDSFPVVVFPRLEDGSAASPDLWRGRKIMLHVFASW